MPKPTKYGLNKYAKAIEILAIRRGFHNFECVANKGSKYTFRLYQKKEDQVPSNIWGVHVEHSRKKEIWKRDLEKAWVNLGVSEQDFMELIDTL